jgi:hypothetical protein
MKRKVLARQSQLPIKTFVNSLGVFELRKKVKRKKAKLWNPDKSGWFFKFDGIRLREMLRRTGVRGER